MPYSRTLSDDVADGILSGNTWIRKLLSTNNGITLIRNKFISKSYEHLNAT
jgi:hypothetical protein